MCEPVMRPKSRTPSSVVEKLTMGWPEKSSARTSTAIGVPVVAIGRNLREQNRIPVKQPLPAIKIAATGGSSALREALTDVAQEELNVKAVSWIADPAELVNLSVKANFKVLGRLLGPKMKPVANAIGQLGTSDIAALQSGRRGLGGCDRGSAEHAFDDSVVLTACCGTGST